MSWLTDLQALFTAAPTSLTFGTNLFTSLKSQLPTDQAQDKYLTVVATGGTGPTYIHNKKDPAFRHPGAAITAFAKKQSDASGLAEQAFQAVVAVRNQQINGTGFFYLKLKPLQEPFELPITPDGYSRWRFNIVGERR